MIANGSITSGVPASGIRPAPRGHGDRAAVEQLLQPRGELVAVFARLAYMRCPSLIDQLPTLPKVCNSLDERSEVDGSCSARQVVNHD